ncbi:MAG: aspartyl aminopeptidase [Planctomycetota bacterium]|jgi:aspartyl aminopeptidase
MPQKPDLSAAQDLCAFVDASPSPTHACIEAARRLQAAGFKELSELDSWEEAAGRWYVVRAGSLAAWIVPTDGDPDTGFRLLGAHTDSPNLRIKPKPDTGRAGLRQLGVEIYGGVLLNSWLDRDLGLSGTVVVNEDGRPAKRNFRIDEPVLRIPQLAIHLHREIYTEGLKLNKQLHMQPIFGVGKTRDGEFKEYLAAKVGADPATVLGFEAMTHDLTPSCVSGSDQDWLSAPRLDNLASSWACLQALLEAADDERLKHVPVITLFDHEEVGSATRSGADGPLLRTLLERISHARGDDRDAFQRALARSLCVSSDMAHATNPNYADKHDPGHLVHLNAGPVIKHNANQRYATEVESAARFALACQRADVPYQEWAMRSDLACGSTIGPITAANLGVLTVDVGGPQLAMHSAREMCGSHDPGYMKEALRELLLED